MPSLPPSDQTELDELSEHMQAIVNNWCPKGPLFDLEPFQVRLMRAFMHVTAYAADVKRVFNGEQPIRPLDSYPDPMIGFEPNRAKKPAKQR